MKEQELRTLNYQILLSLLFILTIIISIILTYDQKLEISNKKRLFSKTFDKYLNLFNRLLALFIVSALLYLNYQDYKKGKIKNINQDALRHQVYASIFSFISAIIVLYVVIENWYDIPNISNIENPII